MIKFIRNVISLLIAVIIGFWLAETDLLNGTTIGGWLDTIVNSIPSPNDFSNSLDLVQSGDSIESNEDSSTDSPLIVNESTEVDYQKVENQILVLLNELRQNQDLKTLQKNDVLKRAADLRAVETETLFSHTRPDGSDAFTVFEEEGMNYSYRIVGENLGMATYHLDESGMAELLFNGWVESEGHYENMIRTEYEEIGIGVHFDGEFLYAAQLFGTPL